MHYQVVLNIAKLHLDSVPKAVYALARPPAHCFDAELLVEIMYEYFTQCFSQ
jgi:hypothetical protein